MIRQWGVFAAMCSVLMGIVLFSVIFGGYSSFYRSRNRIEASKELITTVCRDRSAIILQVLDKTRETAHPERWTALKQALEEADIILLQVTSRKMPLDKALTQEFEVAEDRLTSELARLISSWDGTGKAYPEDLSDLIQKRLFVSQDNVFVARKKYNSEVGYFMVRKSVFPGYLIAGLFGFDQMVYHGLSENSFLSAEKAFNHQGR